MHARSHIQALPAPKASVTEDVWHWG